MGYSRPMGFCMQIPAHRVGGPEKVWDTRGYGLSEVCVMTGSTVLSELPCSSAGPPCLPQQISPPLLLYVRNLANGVFFCHKLLFWEVEFSISCHNCRFVPCRTLNIYHDIVQLSNACLHVVASRSLRPSPNAHRKMFTQATGKACTASRECFIRLLQESTQGCERQN